MLQGRAYLEARVKLKEKRYNNVSGGVMKIVVDGYNAPVTAGAFVDLVDKKFYDGMEIQRADGMVVQTGRPEGEVRLCSASAILLYLLPAILSVSLHDCCCQIRAPASPLLPLQGLTPSHCCLAFST